MKNLKRISSFILALLMLVTLNSFTFMAYAQGTGSEDNPYQITTATELQSINNNPSAHYKLMANINLNDVDFIPIGNADSGAFSGSFDGNGYTVSNLNVFSGKYAGLFGCNEGEIKNVTLSNIYVYGTRYIGGVVAYNTEHGVISNCTVKSGNIQSDGGLYDINIGGICGYNNGIMTDILSNGAYVSVNASNKTYAGGIAGYNNATGALSHYYNIGDISLKGSSNDYAYIGGFFGYTNNSITITNSYNTGNVTGSSYYYYYSYVGGLVGYGNSTITITNSYNTGNVTGSSSYSSYVGGLVGYGKSTITIINSYNTGNVSVDDYSGGLVGYGNSTITITNSYNTGKVSSDYFSGGLVGYAVNTVTITKSYNNGNVYCYSTVSNNAKAGGFIGEAHDDLAISNSYNTGNVYASSSSYSSYGYAGGFLGYLYNTVTISNSYNTGNVYSYYHDSYYHDSLGGFIGIATYSTITNSYSLIHSSRYCGKSGELKTSAQMQSRETYVDWNFSDIWEFKSGINGGYPLLKNISSPLQLNNSNTTLKTGESLTLTAFKNGTATNDVTWSVSYGNAAVSANGLVVVGSGPSTITATDSQGNKANCNVHGYIPTNSLTSSDKSVHLSDGGFYSDFEMNEGSTDFIISYSSSNPSVATVDSDGYITPISAGTTVITATTIGGVVGTQNVTVEGYAKSLSISKTSMTINRGKTSQLIATTNPSPTSSAITWTSSNEDVATVDQNGNVTGVGIGNAVIKVATDNGYSATCNVTVNAPVTSMEFENPSITVYKGDVQNLNLIYAPFDTTDSISYSCSSSSSYLSVDSTGTVTAKSTGTYTVTARSSSGKETTCKVTVLNYPVVVTGIELDQDEHDMLVGEVFKLNATVTPSNATNKTITWASTDETVASVSQAGTVEAKGAGKTLITAETENGIIAYCIVNVTGVASTNLSKIYVPDVLATEEDYVDIPVMIENNPGISFASISVLYDADKLEPVSVTNGDVFNSVLGSIENSESKVKLCFTSDVDITDDGVLATIRFNVLDKNSEPQVKVCYFPSEIRNTQAVAVAFNLGDGRVSMHKCSHKNTELIDAREESCTQSGYTGNLYCVDCGVLIQSGKIIAELGHNYNPVITKPTCTAKGYTTYTCSRCKDSYIDDYTDKTDHNFDSGKVTKPATCTTTGVKTYTCTVCGDTKIETIAKKTHNYKTYTTKATTSKNGTVVTKCSVCGIVKSKSTIYYPKSVVLSSTTYTYDGKEKKPSVKIVGSNGKTISSSYYTVSYASGRKNVGKYSVKITFKGNYSGTKTLYYTINPKGTTLSTLTATSKGFKVTWKKQATQTTGYQIQYATNSRFDNAKLYTISKNTTTSKTFTKLSAKKKYYVRVRTYKTVNGKKYYSGWSSYKYVTTKI